MSVPGPHYLTTRLIGALLLGAAVLLCPDAPFAAEAPSYDRGVRALNMGDYATALKEFREAAEQGNPKAQFHLGLMYERAWGVSEDRAEAARWYRKAAEQGHNLAPRALSRLAKSEDIDILQFSPPDAQWSVGHEQYLKGKSAITEFVRPGETVQNWTELLTVFTFPPKYLLSPDITMKFLKAKIEKRCQNVVWNVIQREEKKVLFEWKITDCSAHPDQHEVALLIYGKWTVFKISYVEKVKELTPEVRDKWIKAFSEAKAVPKDFGRSRGSGN